MLRKVKNFENFTLRTRDGDIGKAVEFYFDDRHWTIRYLVVDTGGWLHSRKVLISPHALNPAIDDDNVIPVNLTKQQIENSPSIDSDIPVSRQFEVDYHNFYSWPYYGIGSFTWGTSSYLGGAGPFIRGRGQPTSEMVRPEESWDPCLRSTHEVTGYHVHSTDGEIGHVSDFVIDEATWTIRYLVVDTNNLWPGRQVLISTHWIDEVAWLDHKVFVHVNKEAVEHAPEYSPETLNRGYEELLHEHYNSHGYWFDRLPQQMPMAPIQAHPEEKK